MITTINDSYICIYISHNISFQLSCPFSYSSILSLIHPRNTLLLPFFLPSFFPTSKTLTSTGFQSCTAKILALRCMGNDEFVDSVKPADQYGAILDKLVCCPMSIHL